MTQDEMKADFERWVVKSWPLESFNMESYCEDAYGTLQYYEDFMQGMWLMYVSMQSAPTADMLGSGGNDAGPRTNLISFCSG